MNEESISAHASRVIVLGVDTPIGVAILRDLGRHGHYTIGIGRSRHAIGFASRYCHKQVVRPSSELELVNRLHEIAAEFAGVSLITISENDNQLVNRNRTGLEKILRILAPTQAMLEQVLDKSVCISLAREVGIRVPDTFQPKNLTEIQQRASTLSYPCVIKWAEPNSVGNALAKHGLTAHKYQYAYDVHDLIEKLSPYARINRFPLVQEYCPGRGIGQMFLVRNGEVSLQFQHERIHEWPPEGGISTLCKSLPLSVHQECRQRSIALLRKLRWNGVAMVEYRYHSETDTYYFMEINGRFWGSLPLAIAAGVPFASGLVDEAKGHAVERLQSNYSNIYCRFMVPELRRLTRLLLQPSQIQDPLFHYSRMKEIQRFLLDFIRPKTRYFLFTITDPGPFLADIRNILFKLVHRTR